MDDVRVKKHWFLKYPLVPAFVLPLLSIIGIFLITQLLLLVLPTVFGEGIRTFRQFPNVSQSVLRIALSFLIIIVMKYSSKGRFQFGFHQKNLGLSIGLSSIAGIVAAYNILDSSLAGIPVHTTVSGILIAILGGIAPGLFEEVVCRGVVLSNMMERWNKKNNYILKSVLASGIAFGLVHLINLINGDISGTFLQVFYAAGLGIFFGSVFLRTRNLLGTVIVHSLIDISAEIFVGETETAMLTVVVSILITIVYTLVGLYLIRPKKQEGIRALWESPQTAWSF